MRFPARTRESPYFCASTRPIVKHISQLPLKVVQARLGHASIQMTADVYGHLFPRGDDGAELAAAERAFLGS
jgi:integrase